MVFLWTLALLLTFPSNGEAAKKKKKKDTSVLVCPKKKQTKTIEKVSPREVICVPESNLLLIYSTRDRDDMRAHKMPKKDEYHYRYAFPGFHDASAVAIPISFGTHGPPVEARVLEVCAMESRDPAKEGIIIKLSLKGLASSSLQAITLNTIVRFKSFPDLSESGLCGSLREEPEE